MRERGVLPSSAGPQAHILKIGPPLVFSQANADQPVDTLDTVLQSL